MSEAEEEGSEMPAALAVDDSVQSDAVSEPTSELDDGEPVENAASGEGEGNQVEGAEPARIPTSLTATLREQGPRFQHRMSRRMRRKMRAGGPAPAEGQRTANASEVKAPEARVEVKAEAPRPAPRPDRSGPPSISDLLREGQEIIVQIAKEPLGQKGARITSHIALPGRFLVYMPTVDHIGVSRKIPSEEERTRLKRVLQSNRTGIPGGYIVRTAGDGRTEEELRADMMFLYNLWLDLRQKAEKRAAPALVHHDLDVVQRILRDQLTSAFKTILVDNEEVYESVLSFVQRFQPALVNRVKLYTRSNPIFDEFGITAELEKALRPKVWLKSGGYIVINQTEALVAIDINTGKFVGKSNRLEDTIVKTNTDAIREIVRQIRLRDLGGIIVVDFIDMDERKNRQKVMQALEEAMRADRAPYKILQFNDFGLVAITRKRVKQSLERTLCAPCPYCEGAGYVKNVQTVIGEILQEAHKMAGVLDKGDVTLRVNPEVAKTLKSNKNDFMQEIEEILGRTVLVKSDPQMHQQKFDLA
jgi:ribonuclease G